MTQRDDFYMVLPSNASPNNQPNNTAGDFIVTWENPIDLDRDSSWKVALTELSYLYKPSTVSTNYSIKYDKTVMTEQYNVKMKLFHDPKAKDEIGHRLVENVWWDHFRVDKQGYRLHTHDGVRDQPNEEYDFSINLDTWIPKVIRNPLKDEMIVICKRPFTISMSKENAEKTSFPLEAVLSAKRTPDGFWYVPIEMYHVPFVDLLKGTEIQYECKVHKFSIWSYTFYFPTDMDFHKPDDFVKYMAENCNDIFSDIKYDKNEKRVELTFKFNVVKVHLCGGLNFAFGFRNTVLIDPDIELRKHNYQTGELYTVKSTEPPQLHRGVINMYIYASICQPIYVGHTQVPLLKSIFVDSDDANEAGHAKNYVVYNPMYVPVSTKSFTSIEINIRNDAGHIINFPDGAITLLTLHFRNK